MPRVRKLISLICRRDRPPHAEAPPVPTGRQRASASSAVTVLRAQAGAWSPPTPVRSGSASSARTRHLLPPALGSPAESRAPPYGAAPAPRRRSGCGSAKLLRKCQNRDNAAVGDGCFDSHGIPLSRSFEGRLTQSGSSCASQSAQHQTALGCPSRKLYGVALRSLGSDTRRTR